MLNWVNKNVALVAALSMAAAVGAGCKSQPQGSAKVAVNVNALSATSISKVTLTVGPGTGTPSFTPIVADLTNQDPAKKLSWSGFLQGIPAGTGRTFHVDAFAADGTTVLYSTIAGNQTTDPTATITAGATANVYVVLQEKNPQGDFTNALPVIDSLTASASTVTIATPSPTVNLAVTAHSPNTPPSNPLTYAWTSPSCGTLAGSTTQNPVWTAPTTPGTCQINVTVTDSRQGSVTASLAIVVQAPSTGSAQVNAYANSWPMISGIVAAETFTKDASGKIVAIDVDLTASAGDPDGDDLTYTWSSPDCLYPAAGFTSSTVPTLAASITTGPGQLTTSAVHFRSGDPSHGCTIRVDVTDSWKDGIVPVGSGLPVARGGDTVGLINASTPTDFVLAPQITKIIQPNASNSVLPDQVVTVGIETLDPTPNFNMAQTPFTYSWSLTPGITKVGEVSVTSSPGKDSVQLAFSDPLQAPMSATVTVTNVAGLTASHTFVFVPANPCDGTLASIGLACDTGLGLCAGNSTGAGQCTAQGTCVSSTAVVCTALDQCHDVGICNPSSGTCSNPTKPVGTACSDGSGCSTNDVCNAAGACAGAAVVCNTPPNTACYSTAGTCTSTSASTFACNYTTLPAGTVCPNANLCFQTNLCDGAGTCVASNPVNCVGAQCSSGGTCNPATGTCQGGSNLPPGTACNDSNACTGNDVCNGSGACAGTPICAAGQSCAPTVGICTDSVPVPQLAKDLQLANFQGLALATDGSAYVTGVLLLPTKTFDGFSVTSAGAGDVFLAKYPAGGGAAVWAKNYGDSADQQPTAVAVTADNTVIAIGQFLGVLGTASNTAATPIDYVMGIDGATGSTKWVKSFDNGVSGALFTVAANPALNQVAVCGHISAFAGTSPTTALVPGVTYGGGTDDVVIAMFDSTGALKWSKEIGGANEEECDALAIDDVGDLYAAGKYDGALTFTGTALPSPASSFRRWIWVAKFNGTTGAAIAQASFGSGAGNHKPQGIAVDSSDNVVVAGFMTNSLPFGTTTLVSAGGTDVFVAKLDPALSPQWAGRMGGTSADEARGVAIDSFGNAIVTGLINGTTTGLAALTAASTTASSAFIMKLNAATGLVVPTTAAGPGAAAYGNATNTVNGNKVAVNRQGSGAALNAVVVGGEYGGSLSFGGTTTAISTTGSADFLVFEQLQ